MSNGPFNPVVILRDPDFRGQPIHSPLDIKNLNIRPCPATVRYFRAVEATKCLSLGIYSHFQDYPDLTGNLSPRRVQDYPDLTGNLSPRRATRCFVPRAISPGPLCVTKENL